MLNEWESAWEEYILALQLLDAKICGEDWPYWAGVAAIRLYEAELKLRSLDPEFCKAIGV